MSTEVIDAGTRFEIHVDGALAGFTDYHDRDDVRTFPHTEVDPAYQGQGLASQVIRGALDATRAAGLGVRPLCSAVLGFITKHEEYADLVPAELRGDFGLEDPGGRS